MLVFKNYFHFALQCTDDDDDDKNLRFVAATIKAETSATDRNQYKVQFDVDTVNEDFSAILMDLLEEINIGKLTFDSCWYDLLVIYL